MHKCINEHSLGNMCNWNWSSILTSRRTDVVSNCRIERRSLLYLQKMLFCATSIDISQLLWLIKIEVKLSLQLTRTLNRDEFACRLLHLGYNQWTYTIVNDFRFLAAQIRMPHYVHCHLNSSLQLAVSILVRYRKFSRSWLSFVIDQFNLLSASILELMTVLLMIMLTFLACPDYNRI